MVAAAILLVKNWDKVKAAGLEAWEKIKEVWNSVATWFDTNVINPIINIFSTIVAVVGGFFTTLWGNIVAVWMAAGAWFSENVAAPINAAFQAVSDFVKGIFNGLLGFVENMINGVIGAINKFVGGFSGIVEKAAGFIGVEWSGINEIPQVTLPRLATGGIVTAPTILEAGEGGEAEAILPLSKLAAMLQSVANAPEIPDMGDREDGPEEAPLAHLAKCWTTGPGTTNRTRMGRARAAVVAGTSRSRSQLEQTAPHHRRVARTRRAAWTRSPLPLCSTFTRELPKRRPWRPGG